MRKMTVQTVPLHTPYRFPKGDTKQCQCLYQVIQRGPNEITIEILKDCGGKWCRSGVDRVGHTFYYSKSSYNFEVVVESFTEAMSRVEK